MKTESLHRGWGRFAAAAGVLALLLAAPPSASAADFLSGAVSDFPTDWSVSDGLQPESVATKSVSGAELRLAFDLDANQSLTYAPPTASDAGGRADVVISNAVFSTAYDYPGPEDVGGIESQAAICVHTNGTGGLEYCGWAGAYAGAGTATTNLTWFVLSGATPVEGATNTVTMSFDYTVSPATVTFKIGDTELTPKPVALETTKTQVSAVSFSGRGSIGELAGETSPNAFAVNFYTNDVANVFWTTNVPAGDAPAFLGTPNPPAKAATAEYTYAFAGWTNAASAGTVVTLANETIVSPTNYYATFAATPVSYTLSWVSDGDELTGTYTSGLVPFGTTIVPPNTPTKTGYSFDEWTPAPVAGTMPAANTTYTATWNPATDTVYTVNHVQQALDGSYPASPTETESKTGTTGSQTAAAAKSYTGFTAGAVTQTAIAADGSTVVTIQYERNSYQLTWTTDGDALTGNYTSGLVPFGTTIVQPDQPTKTGSTFAGWSPAVAATMPAEATTYAATWNAATFTVYWVVNGTTVETDENVPYGTTPTYNGETPTKDSTATTNYTFTVWSPAVGPIAQDTTYTAQFSESPRPYALAWDGNGGALSGDYTAAGSVANGASITAPTAARDGYAFEGWSPEFTGTMPAADTTYVAQWTEVATPVLALAEPTLDSTTVAGPAGTTVSATIAPSATVTATNANASVAVAGTNAVATFSNLAWNEAVDWMLQSEGAADLPGRFYAKGETQWFSTNELADIADLAEGMKGVDMSSAPSPTGQMVRIQTRLEIPEGAQTSLPTGEDVGEARTGFAIAQLSGDAAPAYYAFNGASWDRLFGAAPAEGATNDLLIVLDTVREEAFYYVDGLALYATNAVGDPVYAIGMKASDAAVVKGIGFSNPDGVKAPVVAEYDVPFVADVSGTPYTDSAAAVAALAATNKAAANDVTVTLLADGVAGSVALDEGEQVTVAAGAFDPSGLAFTAAGAPTWKPVSSGTAPTLVWTVAPNDFAVVWHDGDGSELGTTSVVYGTVPVYLGATEPSKAATATTNFTYDGWAASAGGPKLDPLPAVTGPTNFYAHFSESAREYTLTVTFTAPEGFAAPATHTEQVANGAAYSYTPPNVPGCTADPAVVEGTMPTEDVTVAVAYTAIEYTITWNYKAADGSDTSDTTTVVWGQTPSHADPADYVANNTMHSFLAWDTTPAAYDGTVASYTATYSSTAAKATVFTVAGDGATTNTVGYYATLAQAVAAATNGCTVALLANVNEAIVNTADKNFTIDLNGWTWSSDSDVLATAAGTITIEATNGGTMSTEAAQCCAVWAKGGDVVINGGTFTSKDNEEATIYVSNAGSVVTINGGTFENTDTRPYRWKTSLHALTLNVKNDLEGQHLVINGGTFIGNDPQLGDDTAGGTSAQSSVAFVSSGFVAIQDGSGNWVVQPGWNVTFDANGGVPEPAPQRIAAGGTATEPATPPAKEYHAFRAWQTNGVDWVFSTPVAADLTLVADWTQTAFTVTWKNGETVLETDEHVALDAQPSYDSDEPTQEPVGVTTYTFDGWTGGDVASPTAEADLPPVTADVVYTAHFAASGKPVMVISVAGIATNYFDTVAQAVSAAQAGETVVLLADAALSSTVAISKDLTIDLNGKNLAATDCRAIWVKSGDVRITGSGTVSAEGPNLSGSSSVIRVGDSANATAAALLIDTNVVVSSAACYGVTVFGKNDADGDADTADISLDLYGTVSVTSSGDADAAVSGNGHPSLQPVDIVVHDGATVSSANSAAIYFPGRDTLTVGGGTITGLHGIVARAGSVVVNGGSITATGTGAGEALGDSDIVVPYAAVVYDTSANYPWHAAGAAATINGGTIVSAVEPCVVQLSADGDAAAVLIPAGSAAVFSDADAEGVPAGYALKETAAGSGFYALAKTWAVAFTVDGEAYTNLVVFDGEPVSRPVDPQKDCYTFREWQTNGVDWVFTDAVTADLALVADWTRNAVTVTAPAVANATATATTNGVAVAGTPGGNGATLFVVEAGTPVVVTYAADAGYHVYGSDPVSTTADVQVAAADTANDLTLAAGLLPTMEPNVYDVVWENWDETPLATNRVVHGTTTNWVGDTPARASTDDFGYVFASWTTNGVDVAPDAVAIVADTVFAARFDAVSLAAATWIGGASNDWNVATNWDIGYVPTKATVVTFTNDATVGIYRDQCHCKAMVLDDADVTIVRADQGSGYKGSVDLHFQGNAGSAVSGTGTLGLRAVGLFNNNNNGVLSIGTGLAILDSVTFKGVKDDHGHAGSWNVVGKTTIANVSEVLRVSSIDDAVTTFKSNVVIAAGASVEFYAAHGADSGKHAGEIVVDSASTVTLAHSGNSVTKLVMYPYNGGRITANDGQIVADSTGYYVKKYSQSGNKTVYELHPKRTVVSVTATGVTVEGVETGDRFAPGESFTIEVSGLAEGHDAILRITKHNGGSVVATATNELSYVYAMPEYDVDVSVEAVVKTFAVTWLDWDGTTLETDGNAEYDSVPSYDGEAPTREPTDDTTFWFDGWTNAAVANPTAAAALPHVVADAAYGAHYAESNRLYAIDFRSEDGASSYFSTSLTWHAAVVYEGAEPTKPATPALGFVFAGWTNGVVSDPTAVAQLPAVSGDATYFAAFDATNNLYEVVLVADEADGAEFYRTNIVYDGFVVYPQHDPVHEEEGKTFLFRGWTNEVVTTPADPVGPVKEAGTWYAAFEEIDAVAKVVYADGYEEYVDTLAGAVVRAGAGEKAVLLADASGAGFEVDEAITLDLGGHIYEITADDAPIWVTAAGAVVTNGVLRSSTSTLFDVSGSATLVDLALTNDWEAAEDYGAVFVSGAATLVRVDVSSEAFVPAIHFDPDPGYEGESFLYGTNVTALSVEVPTVYALGPFEFADSTFVNAGDGWLPAVYAEYGAAPGTLADCYVYSKSGQAVATDSPLVLSGGLFESAADWCSAIDMQSASATLHATNATVLSACDDDRYGAAVSVLGPFEIVGGTNETTGASCAIRANGASAVGTIFRSAAFSADGVAIVAGNGAAVSVEDAVADAAGAALYAVDGGRIVVTDSDEEDDWGFYASDSSVAWSEGEGSEIGIEGGVFYGGDGVPVVGAELGGAVVVSGGWFSDAVPADCTDPEYAPSPAWPDASPAGADAPFTVYIYRDIAWADFTVAPTSFVYDATAKQPSVSASYTDRHGETETLHVPGDYLVVWPEGRIAAGTYEISVEGTNSWYGTTNLTFEIAKAPLSIVATNAVKTYGDPDPVLGYVATGLVGSDSISGALARGEGETVGEYAISQGDLDAGPNYETAFTGAVFTIVPATVEPPAAPASVVYDGTEKVPGVATSTLWTLSGTNGLVDAGTYEVGVELANKENYTWTDGSTTGLVYRFEIARAEVVPPADPAGAAYDGEVHYASFAESDLWTVSGNVGWTAAGTHGGIEVSLANPANYVWSDGTDAARDYTFTIAKATVARPAAPAGTNYVADTVYADIPASDHYAVSGNDGFRNAGTYGIGVSLLDPANYAWDDGTTNDLAFAFVVAKAPLAATARNVTVDFGDDPDTVVYPIDYVGFLGDDDETNSLDPAPAVWAPEYTADAERNTSFPLVFTNLGASVNYAITCDATDRKLYVAPTPVTLTFDPDGGTDVDLSSMKGAEGVTNAGVNFVVANVGTALDPELFASTREGWVFAGWDPALPAAVPTSGTNYVAQWTEAGAMVISVADAGTGATSTNWCLSLRDAIEAAHNGDTIVLLADDHTSFSLDDLEISIGKALVIDGDGHAVYGVNDYNSYDETTGGEDHDIFVTRNAGDVTIRNLRITEFGGASYVSQQISPLYVSGAYAGTITLENVTIDAFNRHALFVGGGTAVIDGCTIVGDTSPRNVKGAYFQEGVEVYFADVTITNTTISGMGAFDPDWEDSNAAAAVQLTSSGSITVADGSYEGQFAVLVYEGATGTVSLDDGSFEGVLQVDEGSAGSLVVSGGWFDREVPDGYVAEGLLPTTVADASGRYTVKPPRTVSFAAGEGESGLPEALTVAQTDPATEPEQTPAKPGYAFRAWRLGGADYDWSTPVMEDIELAADWTNAIYRVVVRYALPAGVDPIPAATNYVAYQSRYTIASPAVPGCEPTKQIVKGRLEEPGDLEFTVSYRKGLELVQSIVVGNPVYDGTPRTPELTITDYGTELVAGRDYTFVVDEAVDADEGYHIVLRGIGSWTGSTNLVFAVEPAQIEVPSLKDKVYAAAEQSAEIDGDSALYAITAAADGTDAGEYAATVALDDVRNYRWIGGSADPTNLTWSIVPAPLAITTTDLEVGHGTDPADVVYAYEAVGFVGGETLATLGQDARVTSDYVRTADVGDTFEIYLAGVVNAANYDLAVTNGTLAVVSRTFAVQFVGDDGTVVSSADYEYGTPAADVVVPSGPDKPADAQFVYSFREWTPEIADVTNAAVYTAFYDKTNTVAAVVSWNGLETNYVASLADAFLFAEDDETVVLLADTAEPAAEIGQDNFTLDLNGRTWTVSSGTNEVSGDVRIIDTSAAGGGSVEGPFEVAGLLAVGHFVGNAVTVTGDVVASGPDAEVVVAYGSTVDGDVVADSGAWATVYGNVSGDVTATGDDGDGNPSFVSVLSGTVGGDVVAEDGAEIEISGGTLDGTLSAENGGTIEISGGRFAEKPADEFVKDGFVAVPDADAGYYKVVARTPIHLATIVAEDAVYDGQPHTVALSFEGKGLELDTDYTAAYTNAIPGGTAEGNVNCGRITATVTGIGKWIGTINVSFSITNRAITLVAASDEKVYDGTPLATNGWTLAEGSLAEGDSFETVTVEGSQTEIGVSANAVTDVFITNKYGNAVAGNYDITLVDGTLTVVAGKPDWVEITGISLSADGTTVTIEHKVDPAAAYHTIFTCTDLSRQEWVAAESSRPTAQLTVVDGKATVELPASGNVRFFAASTSGRAFASSEPLPAEDGGEEP